MYEPAEKRDLLKRETLQCHSEDVWRERGSSRALGGCTAAHEMVVVPFTQLVRQPLPRGKKEFSSFARVSCLRPCSHFSGDSRLSALTLGWLQHISAPGTAHSRQHRGLWSHRLRYGAESHGYSSRRSPKRCHVARRVGLRDGGGGYCVY